MQRSNVSVRTKLCIHFGAYPRGLLCEIYASFTRTLYEKTLRRRLAITMGTVAMIAAILPLYLSGKPR